MDQFRHQNLQNYANGCSKSSIHPFIGTFVFLRTLTLRRSPDLIFSNFFLFSAVGWATVGKGIVLDMSGSCATSDGSFPIFHRLFRDWLVLTGFMGCWMTLSFPSSPSDSTPGIVTDESATVRHFMNHVTFDCYLDCFLGQ